MSQDQSAQTGVEHASETTPRRRWWFRVVAVLLGLSTFALAEGICILFDWGRPTDYPDPYVGFQEIHPLFVLDSSETRYEIPKSRLGFFAPESFPAEKTDRTFRIFCLGGSTVQGRPYSKPTAFTTWLELSLTAGDADREWEVINCGGVSYASYRLVPILQECLTHQPDMIVLCTGHNEFLEERSYGHIKHASPLVAVPMQQLSRMRTFTLLRSAVLSISGQDEMNAPADRPILKKDVDALLDYNGGTKAYHRDDEWKAGVVEHFEFNVRRMIQLANHAGVPIVLVLPPSNLKDSPPFKSEHQKHLSQQQIDEWQGVVKKARLHYRNDLPKAVKLLEQAIEIDDRYAATYFELGNCCDALWQQTRNRSWRDRAMTAYRRALEEDICPLRIVAPMEQALRRIAEETETPLIDAHALLQQKNGERILGNGLLVDHVHPSPIRGHQLLSLALCDELKRQGLFTPADDWIEKRTQAFDTHRNSLDHLYFARGDRTLRALRAWAAGRADVSYETLGQPIVDLADYTITGEADIAFARICREILADNSPVEKVIPAALPDFSDLKLPYDLYADDDIAHRVLYVEASRGCPFTCEFCLSALEIPVRQAPLDPFLSAMQTLFDRGARQFKFVDRTFNLNLRVGSAILEFFLERCEPGLFLHFEMIPDRLPEPLRALIARFPPGALQFEVGIQTFNEEVSERISRKQNNTRVEDNLRFLREETGVHVHADLIVGLPGESIESFGDGFDRLVAMRPQEIQVGMLKRLRGTPIVRHDEEWDMRYSPSPPYEILQNRLIDFADMSRMRRFARYWDLVANSGNFVKSLPLIWGNGSPFHGFMRFAEWLFEHEGRSHGIPLTRLVERVFQFATTIAHAEEQTAAELVYSDYRRGGRRDIPRFLRRFNLDVTREPTTPSAAPARQSRHMVEG
eukprot:g21996.t1